MGLLETLIEREKYLKLNDSGDIVLDYKGKLEVIDFHTHMGNVLPLKSVDPNSKGTKLKYPTLLPIQDIDFSVPYWKKEGANKSKGGFLTLVEYVFQAYRIVQDMTKGGTYSNCFKSQDENQISKNVVLPISTKKRDCSLEALRLVHEHPSRFIAFCSVHPDDPMALSKVAQYKMLGAKGLKLKISDLELKNDFHSLLNLFKACHEVGLPVLLHTGTVPIESSKRSSLYWKLNQSTRVALFGELLKCMPKDFIFVFGHSGVSEYKQVASYLQQFPSSYAELSSQSEQSIQYLIEAVGGKRLLFGSDWPALPQAVTLSRVLMATEKDQQARADILCDNAKRILLD